MPKDSPVNGHSLFDLTIACTGDTHVDSHHIAETVYKGLVRSLRMAVEPDPRQPGIPRTKGTLTQA